MLTAQDMQNRISDYLGGDVTGKVGLREIRSSIRDSLDEFALAHAWPQYLYEKIITVPAAYQTGTVAYTASTRTLVLSGGTFPTWAATGGVVRFNNVHSRVQTRTDGTTLVLESDTAPTSDVAAGEAFYLYRDSFVLDVRTHMINRVFGYAPSQELQYWPPHRWHEVSEAFNVYNRTGRLLYYTMLGDPANFGLQRIQFAPPVATEEVVLRVQMKRLPRAIAFWLEETGTVSVAATTTVTGSGTAFTAAMVGSVIRISNSAVKKPSDLDGDYPYVEERRITAYASATSITVDSAFSSTQSGVLYSISDPIDVEETIMRRAFFYCCIKNLSDRKETKVLAERRALYEEELEMAKGAAFRPLQRNYADGVMA